MTTSQKPTCGNCRFPSEMDMDNGEITCENPDKPDRGHSIDKSETCDIHKPKEATDE